MGFSTGQKYFALPCLPVIDVMNFSKNCFDDNFHQKLHRPTTAFEYFAKLI